MLKDNPESLFYFVFPALRYLTLAFALIYFLSAAFMDPGFLTPSIVDEMKTNYTYNNNREDNGEHMKCYKCNLDRPLRCKHCVKCKKCVMVFDHHSQLLQNCVGHRNYKCYFWFITCYFFYCLLSVFLLLFSEKNRFSFSSLFVFTVLSFFLADRVINQTLLLLKNTTQDEAEKNKIEERIFKRHQKKFYNKFNLGNESGNIRCRFGPNALTWFLPTPNNGCGYAFRINPVFTAPYEFAFHDNFEADDEINEEEEKKNVIVE